MAAGLASAPAAVAGDDEDTGALWSVAPDGTRAIVAAPGGLDIGPSASWSPDGRQIAFVRYTTAAGKPANFGRLIVKAADGSGEETAVANNVSALEPRPVWSPDGQRIAFADGPGDIRTVAPTGGPVARLTHAFDAEHLRWSPDGSAIVYSDEYRVLCARDAKGHRAASLTNVIYVVGADGTRRRLTATSDCSPTRATTDELPVWTGNHTVAFVRGLKNITLDKPLTSTVYVASVDHPSRLRKVAIPTREHWRVLGGDLVPSPDRRTLAVEIDPFSYAPGEVDYSDASQLWLLAVDGSATHKLPLRAFEGGSPTFAPNGDVTDCGNRGVLRFDAKTGKRRLLARFGDCLTGDWAPDGSRLLVAADLSS